MTTPVKPTNLVANCIIQARAADGNAPTEIIEFFDDATSSLWITGYVIVPLETMAEHPHALQRLAIEKLRELAAVGEVAKPENMRTTPDKPHMLANNVFLTPGWMQPQTKGPVQ